jgi:hypothetical protein
MHTENKNNLVSQVFNELDELRGRLTSLRVRYPDTDVRLSQSCDLLDQILVKPTEALIKEAIRDLYELREYFLDIAKHFPKDSEVEKAFIPSLRLINGLLSLPSTD